MINPKLKQDLDAIMCSLIEEVHKLHEEYDVPMGDLTVTLDHDEPECECDCEPEDVSSDRLLNRSQVRDFQAFEEDLKAARQRYFNIKDAAFQELSETVGDIITSALDSELDDVAVHLSASTILRTALVDQGEAYA